ncbi:MAG: NADH-quinone oxidoreductase subunit N, partial [Gammaproteobacteria bacterium]|nr:NADH-quinone oxidoreductase subunit N [Gammaproteobacteria bacterium]
MSFEMPIFGLAAAEIFVLCMVCIVLVFDVFSNDPERRWTYWLTLATVIGAAFLTWNIDGQPRQLTFADTFISDGISRLLKLFTYAVILLVFIYSMKYLRDRLLVKGEFLILGLFALLGVMVLASAHHFLTLYLGLELLSLSLYAMVAFDRDSPVAAESAMKYFVLGAIASGCLLYGMSVLYGVSGTLELGAVGAALSADLSGGERVAMLLGLSFVLVAVAFKLGAVPFHMWIPDVYHGAPTASTLFIGSVSKIAAFALIFRLLIDGLGDLYTSWRDMLMV